jgi:hypothetical protein
MEAERLLWEVSKEAEIIDRISMARSLWEKEAEAKQIDDKQRAHSFESSFLEDKVERAAAKVYARLEDRGVSFGVSNPSLDQLTDLFDRVGTENDVNSHLVDRTGTVECVGSDHDSNDFDGETQRRGHVISNEGDATEPSNGTLTKDVQSTPPPAVEKLSSKTAENSTPRRRNSKPRSVPFRSVRKAFASVTGLHGLLTPSSSQLDQRCHRRRQKQRQQSVNETSVKIHPLRDQIDADGVFVENSVSMDELQSSVSRQSISLMDETPPTESTTPTLDDSWENSSVLNYADVYDASSWESNESEGMQDPLEPPPFPDMD